MTIAEKLKDAYNDRKTLRREKIRSKTNQFYRYTRWLRVLLMVVSLTIMAFQRPSWCDFKLKNETYTKSWLRPVPPDLSRLSQSLSPQTLAISNRTLLFVEYKEE